MSRLGPFVRDFLTPVLVLALGGVVAYDHLSPHSPAVSPVVVDGKLLGRKFATAVASSFGDAWMAAATVLEQGKPIADAQTALQTSWREGRTKAFTAQVAPEFAKILSEGTEPTNPAQRSAVVKLWREFAQGLKGGR